MWQSFKRFIFSHPLLLCIGLYFFVRLINVTLLPIFNDEAIYLDWGWRELHAPGYLFYSLYDSKQPLLMWLFGISEMIFPDPLFAGRIISLFFGMATLVGIYQIAKNYISQHAAILAALLYTIIPIFAFYDRQALMESAIGTVGVWTMLWLVKYFQKPRQLYAILFGLFFALGFWIKSSSLLLMLSAAFLFMMYTIKNKGKKSSIVLAVLSILTFLLCMIPLFLQQNFWATLSSNSRYSLTLQELLHFPFNVWVPNAWLNTQILFFFVTPVVLLFAIMGIALSLKRKSSLSYIALGTLCAILLQTLLIRSTSQRYLVSYLPLLSIFAALGVTYLSQKYQKITYALLTLLFVIPLVMTTMQLFFPLRYIQDVGKFTFASQYEYTNGYTSGIGIPETIDYLKNKAQNQPLIVAVALNTGNPESALITYFAQSQNIKVTYLDARIMGDTLNTIDCIGSPFPMYFISRDDYTAGVAKFFVLKKKIENPFSPYYIGIYALNTTCKGKKLNFTFN